MTNPHLNQFVEAWLGKAENYSNTELQGVFDRFFSLFVSFNALYQDATNQLIARQRITPQSATDSQSATKHVIAFIGPRNLQNWLIQNCQNDLDEMVSLIEDGTFYINTHRGSSLPDHASDREQTRGIKSLEPEKYCLGILKLIYKTRCNMFHGSKEFSHIQIQLLRPMNSILLAVINCLRSALGNS